MTEPHIIAETEQLLVLDKPAGLIVHRDGRTQEPSLAEWLIERCPAQAAVGEPWLSPQGEAVPLGGIVHRLDRTTSGVVLAAKTGAMWDYLKGEFKARRVEKSYRAYVHGHMESTSGRIVAEIMRSSDIPRRWYARATDESDIRAAITDWRLIEKLTDPASGEPISYLELSPMTGRTHQIRVHLASIGHPIVGDHLYASEREPALGFLRPALHAHTITLALPSGEQVIYTAPLPPDFARIDASEGE